MGLDLGMREYQYFFLVQVACMLWNKVLLAAKWFRIVFSQVNLLLPRSYQSLSHMEPNLPWLHFIIVTGKCDPIHSTSPIGLLQPAQVCGLEGLCPFPLASISHSFHMANAAATPTKSAGSTTLLCPRPSSCPAGWLLKAPCSSHQSWLIVTVLPKSNWKDILVYQGDRSFSQL